MMMMGKKALFLALAACLLVGPTCSKRVPLLSSLDELKEDDYVYVTLTDGTTLEGRIKAVAKDRIELTGPDIVEADQVEALQIKQTQTAMTLAMMAIILMMIIVVVLIMRRKPRPEQA